ncbi:CaiB/BaiF CoA transferase family protein [Variovorax sp.]|uniref:CaiB/BaiF CoA transferase family protein n=1 Tax=Variovorax sp. TaxID=1871043 RepID=UPI003BA8B05B
MMPPLEGIRVLDLSTLLPGPLCTLLLADAGAEVIKIERPGRGDEMRSYEPRFGGDSANFALLNRGKRSLALDLKQPDDRAAFLELVATADVLVEQFRPGVMQRLGLDPAALARVNPRLVYCSITGYGQHGPLAEVAAHDLNYLAQSGMLGLSAGADGTPPLPQALVADIAGGCYPAVMNILLALRQRDGTGTGCHLDVAMADNLFTLMYWGLAEGQATGRWPRAGRGLVTGGTPRYQVYATRDGRHLAVAPLEDKFWRAFLEIVEAPELEDPALDPQATRDAVASAIAQRTADEWLRRFEGGDVCVALVATLEEAVAHPHFRARGLFERRVRNADGAEIAALPLPVDARFRAGGTSAVYPPLGEARPQEFADTLGAERFR